MSGQETPYHWLDHLAGFDPDLHYTGKLRFARVVCTGNGKHATEDIGVIFESSIDSEGVVGVGVVPKVLYAGRSIQISATENRYTWPMIGHNVIPEAQRQMLAEADPNRQQYREQIGGRGSVIGWCPKGCREMRISRKTWEKIVSKAFEVTIVDFSRHARTVRKTPDP